MNTREKWAEMQESDLTKKQIENLNVIFDEIVCESEQRKQIPVFSGVVKYFPNAIKEIAKCSYKGNEQHHPNTPLHWDKNKSKDNADALMRHLIDHIEDPVDTDGQLHLAKVAWRALALLEVYLENK